jgi:seryl-tRNA synthetase
MLDIKFIRDNSEIIKLAATKKKLKFDVDELIKIDTERVDIMKRAEDLRAKQNAAGESMQRVVGAEREELLNSLKTVKEDLKKVEDELEPVMKKWRELMLQVPNIPDMSVPDGQSDEDNQEIRKVGEPRNFDFTPLDHIQIMEQNDMVDFERGTKTSGFRGYFLKNDGALLEMAVWQYVMQKWSKKDFTPMIVPAMVKRETLLGSGYLPQGEEDLYKDGDDYMTGTGEVATMYYHSGEVMDKSELPKKFLAFSTCFRKEAGSHGKDVKGLVRVHEFYKLEQVILCEASHETSVIHHEELLRNAEEMMEELGIPYHTVVNCGADLGLGQVKKYDIEAWMPSQNKYRETHSCSYFHDFQTRRLNIRYKDADGKVRFAHSLNNTAAATPRLITAIIENYQNADGTVTVPEVLIPYVGKTILGKSKVA